MHKIVRENSSGKTKELIGLAYTDGATIVCRNPLHMIEKIHAYGFSNINTISYDDYLNTGYKDRQNNKYFIRNVDQFLELLNIEGFTLTI